jgi:hypothetical protein
MASVRSKEDEGQVVIDAMNRVSTFDISFKIDPAYPVILSENNLDNPVIMSKYFSTSQHPSLSIDNSGQAGRSFLLHKKRTR